MKFYFFALFIAFIPHYAGAEEVEPKADISRFHIHEELTPKLMEDFINNPPDPDEYSALQKEDYDMEKIACYAAEHYPEKIDDIFPGGYRWIPRCQDWSLSNKVPEFNKLEKKYVQLSGVYNICGTIIHDIGASISSYFIKAGASPDFGKKNFAKQKARYENFLSDMDRWASAGVWENEQYKQLQLLKDKATPAISGYYAKQFHLSKNEANEDAIDLLKQVDMLYLNRYSSCSYRQIPNDKEIDEFLMHPDFAVLNEKLDKDCPNNHFTIANDEWIAAMLRTAIVRHRALADIQHLISHLSKDVLPSTLREPIHQAAPHYPEVLELLLKISPESVNEANSFGKTALMYAVQYKNIESVKLLLKYKAYVDTATKMEVEGNGYIACNQNFHLQAGNRTPLMYAAWQGTPEIAKMLVEAHADINLKDTNGDTAFSYLKNNEALNDKEHQELGNILNPALH